MEFIRGIQQLSRPLHRPVVTIGNFDGVHLGHRRIVGLAVAKAGERKGTALAYTFRPHPQNALRPGSPIQLLSTYDEKIELLGATGLDLVIEEPFSREFSTITPEHFFNEILLRKLSAEAIVVGYDFAFGKERKGHLDTLEKLCGKNSVELEIVLPHRVDGEVVSSSRIRQHLLAGEIGLANGLLGRQYMYRGSVFRGDQRGRKIGFPTANLRIEDKLILPFGVYATWASFDGNCLPSVTNVGVRPTFQGRDRKAKSIVVVETHIFDCSPDLYGKTLEVRFVGRLRDEKKFPSWEALRTQIDLDSTEAREILTGRG